MTCDGLLKAKFRQKNTIIRRIFIVPVLFVTITKIAYGRKKLEELESKGPEDADVVPEN